MTPQPHPEGDSLLRRELDRIRLAMEDSVATFHKRCRAEVFDPLQRIVDDIREAHGQLMREPPFGRSSSDEGSGGGAQEWRAVRRYAEGVGQTVLELAARELAAARATTVLEALERSLLDDLGSLARRAPLTVRRPEPPDLYSPSPGDPLTWKVGKWMVRARRTARRSLGTSPPREQVVPLRALLEGHMGERIPVLVLDLTEKLHQSLAQPLLTLEESLTRWVQDFPAAEDRIDSPTCHVAEDTGSVLAAVEIPGESDQDHPVDEEEQNAPVSAKEEVWGVHEVGEVARGLQVDLESLQGSLAPSEEIVEGFQAELARAWDGLEGEVLRSGSFMARATTKGSSGPLPATPPRSGVWEEWHRQSRNRHSLNASLCAFRSEWILILDRLVDGVGREGLVTHLTGADEAVARLEEFRVRSDAIFSGAKVRDTPRLAQEVEKLLDAALADLNRTLLDPFREGPWPVRVRAAGDGASDELAHLISGLPNGLRVHSVQEALGHGEDLRPESPVVEIHLREIAEQAMDVLRLESLRASPGKLLDSLEQKKGEAGEIASILEFNLDSARNELADIDQGEGEPAEIMADARSLTDSGLALTAQALRDLRVGLLQEWEPFVRSAHDLMVHPYREIHERAAVTGSVEEQLLDLRARTQEWLRLRRREVWESAKDVMASLRRGSRRVGIQLLRLVRTGRAVVGTAPITREEAERSLEVIAGLPGFLAGLPQAYQRLFSFDPVTDPGILVGRVDDLEWVRRRLEGWRSKLSGPILITGPTGVGRSSLLNVLRATVFEGFSVREIDLTERIRDEAALSALLAQAFEVPGEAPSDLTQLERALLEAPAGGRPLVAVIERMEHLFLRVPGGTDLLERMVCLQAATASRIIWISTMGQIAWKQVSTQELRIKGLLDVHSLEPLDRGGVEEVIMGRHRRSGLPARFEEPRDPNPILRRKLRRAKEDRGRQDLLREDFFDRLFRASDSSIPMAIFLWLRAADFEAHDGTAHIHPVEPLRIGYLHQDLDMSLFFSLKAFLEHGSLTMEEHSEIFRVTHDESFQIFTSLRGQLLLEPLQVGKTIQSDTSPSTEQRPGYRVPPLLTQSVIQHLKNRNIVH